LLHYQILCMEEEFVFYWAEGNWNCNPLCPVHHVVFNISSRTRSPEVPLPLMFSKRNFVFIFNFSSPFLISHLSHCLSVHHPPPFTHQYQSCSPSLCNFVHPPATPSAFRPNISRSPDLTQYFRVNPAEHKLTLPNTILCHQNCLFTTLTSCVKCVSNVWPAVYDMQCCT